MGWIVTLAITAIAFFIRMFRLGRPAEILFDETYYAKDAWSLLQYGYEGVWRGEGDVVNPPFAQGDYSRLTDQSNFIAHPPIGKWLIAAGESMFGLGPFGWRFMAAVFGALMVFLVIRLGRRLSRSTLIGGLAGLLLTVDGLSFVLSRLALLDIFQAVFLVAGVACVVADRDHFRNRLAAVLLRSGNQTLAGQAGPVIFRPWLLLGGVMFGLGIATKWNTVYALAVFGILVVVWSWSARRLAGAQSRAWAALVKDGIPGFASLVLVAVVTYLASWIPWLKAIAGVKRNWGPADPTQSWIGRTFGESWGALWEWHRAVYNFHTGDGMAHATHYYASNPWVWPVLGRTVGIYAENDIQPGDQGCMAAAGETCMRVITALGTPLLWWAATIALVLALVWWLAGLDWRFGVVVLATCSTWIPWMFAGRGAMFSFYAVTMIPFMAIGLAMAIGVLIGPAHAPRRQVGAILSGVLTALIIANFAFFYPIYTGGLLTRKQWLYRIWLPGWI
ncbi:MAG: phospholipid carrier-dependent glycosyltransferase [Propionibacteriaceae bacterium]|jgi:dolichyl-phosphate-mannose--protein O-mannosyl transferase|nr:phospholipid carrier-dependent glycosyltransferase [Propionibacteriaceae bacterium]